MANTITKNNSFGEVLDALKLKDVKACRECWLDGEEFKEEENDYYFYVRKDGFKTKATCHKDDDFDINKDIKICLERITEKERRNI